MASGLPEKMSVTMVLAAIRRLQQRDCPGFTPDSLLCNEQKVRYASPKRLKILERITDERLKPVAALIGKYRTAGYQEMLAEDML